MRVSRILAVSVLSFALTSCGGQATKPTPSAAPAKPAKPIVKVLYTHFGSEKTVDLVAEISNPSEKTRVGVRTTWKAFDADGIIVGSYTTKRPPIPPKSSILYYGHSGDLSGIADSVKVSLASDGALATRTPQSAVKVGDAAFTRADYNTYDDSQTYEVTAVVTALSDVAGEDVRVDAILRDEGGDIVGVGTAGGPELLEGFGQDLPEMVSKGEKVRVSIDAQVPEGTPATVDVFARQD